MKLLSLAIGFLLIAQAVRGMHAGQSSGTGSYSSPSLSSKGKAPQTRLMLPSIGEAFPGHISPSQGSPTHFSPLSSAPSSPARSPTRTQPPSPKSGGPPSPVLLVPSPRGKKMGWFKKETNKPKLVWDPVVHTAWARLRGKVLSRGGTGVFWRKQQ